VKLKPDFMERLKKAYGDSDCEYVISYKGRPIKKLRRSFATALRKAGIKKKVRLYDVRHMYGTFMARNKADVFAVQELMGHSHISTTRRYLHHAEAMKTDAVNNCLPSLDI
jgi:integrase